MEHGTVSYGTEGTHLNQSVSLIEMAVSLAYLIAALATYWYSPLVK